MLNAVKHTCQKGVGPSGFFWLTESLSYTMPFPPKETSSFIVFGETEPRFPPLKKSENWKGKIKYHSSNTLKICLKLTAC